MDNFDRKPLDSIRGIVHDKLSMILFNKNDETKYKLVGSSAYRLNKYYGDLDILEELTASNSSELVDSVIKNLKRVITNIKKKRMNYLTDFKVGIDVRYSFPIFISKNSSTNGITITNPDTVIKNVASLAKKKLIPRDISTEILDILAIPNAISISEYYFIKNYFRKASTIRWTYEEIMAGKKTLIGGITLTLREAVKHRTLIKIDYVTTLGDQFIEITNFLVLGIVKGNKVVPYNMQEYTLLRDLRLDVDKFLFTDYLYNPFKAIKRMFNISRILWTMNEHTDEVKQYMDKLIAKLLKSDVSFLSKLQSGLTPMSLLIEKGYAIPKVAFKNHLSLLSFNTPNCSLLTTSDINNINSMFDKIYKALDTKGSSKTIKNKVMKLINQLDDYMQKNINYFTTSYIQKKGYSNRNSLALFLPKNSVSAGIINEVPFKKDDIDFIIKTGNGKYPGSIAEIPQDNNLVTVTENINISSTFQSLANDSESFDILGEKQEDEFIYQSKIYDLDQIEIYPTEIVTNDLQITGYDLINPSKIIDLDLVDTNIPQDLLNLNDLLERDLVDINDLPRNTTTRYSVPPDEYAVSRYSVPPDEYAVSRYSVPPDEYAVSRYSVPPDEYAVSRYSVPPDEYAVSRYSVPPDEYAMVYEQEPDQIMIYKQEPDQIMILELPDYDLISELLGSADEFGSKKEYINTAFKIILDLYPNYVKNLVGDRKFKNKASKQRFLKYLLEPVIKQKIMS